MKNDPEPLRNLLGDVGNRLGMESAASVGKVWMHWREIVGPGIAGHADPTSLRQGVLRVRADSPAWATEIGYLGGEIQSRINAAVRSQLVTEVRVWIGPRRQRDRSETAEAPRRSSRSAGETRSTDPEAALERARRAWSRSVAGGRDGASYEGRDGGRSRTGENQEKRR